MTLPFRKIFDSLEEVSVLIKTPIVEVGAKWKLTDQKNKEMNKLLSTHRGEIVILRGFNNKYVSVTTTNQLVSCNSNIGRGEKFELIRLSGTKIAFRTYNDFFVSAYLPPLGNGEIIADRPAISAWEIFSVSFIKDDQISLKAFNNAFVSTNLPPHGGGELIANAQSVSGWEAFYISTISG